MAEFVLKRSEEMLPEFEQMNRVGLFTQSEIKSIIKKTTAHEYKLVRQMKDKKDFLAYIQYKIHLLALIKKRRKRINYYFKKDEIEFAIVGKIHRLFKQCTFRWPEDIKLWYSHIEFCKQWNKKFQLSKIWTAMLQMHGNSKVHLWAMAAKWELEDNHSVENARSIFLRGIRHHPEKLKLWHEYFRMELMHVMKTRQRLALLKRTDDDVEEDAGSELLNGEAASVVYKNAIQAIPNNCKLKCTFLEIALLFSFFAGELINTIIGDIMENHSSDPTARSALARLHMNPHMITQSEEESKNAITVKADSWAAEKRCWEDFESAVEELNSCEMWGEYFDFLYERIQETQQQNDTECEGLGFEITGVRQNANMKRMDEISRLKMDKFLDVASKAHSLKKLTPENYLKFVEMLVKLDRSDEAIGILHECTKCVDSISLQIKLLEIWINTKSSHLSNTEATALFKEISSSTSQMNPDQERKLWELWFEHCKLSDEEYLWEVVEQAGKSKSSCLPEIKAAYLEWYVEKQGVEKGLELYKERLYKNCSPSLLLNNTMIGILDPKDNADAITEIYEDSITNFGNKEPEVWLNYIAFLLKIDPSKVGSIHWRAMKNLKPELTEKFVTGYTLLHTQSNSF